MDNSQVVLNPSSIKIAIFLKAMKENESFGISGVPEETMIERLYEKMKWEIKKLNCTVTEQVRLPARIKYYFGEEGSSPSVSKLIGTFVDCK